MPDEARVDLTTLFTPLTELMAAAAVADPQASTPCSEWSLSDLVAHVAGVTANFAIAAEGGAPDWSTPPGQPADASNVFEAAVQRLQKALPAAPEPIADMACAELSVHAWDLAHALSRETAGLPPEAPERGLAFMRAGLTDAGRGEFFGPEQPAPEDADAYSLIAAFAGRTL